MTCAVHAYPDSCGGGHPPACPWCGRWREGGCPGCEDCRDLLAGDSVTPTSGAFAGLRFIVVETNGAAALVRHFPARMGGPAPMVVERAEVAPFFADCPRCGGRDHHRGCEVPHDLPERGWRIRVRRTFQRDDGSLFCAGERGTVTQVEDGFFAAVELDDGRRVCWGGDALGRFFDDCEVL